MRIGLKQYLYIFIPSTENNVKRDDKTSRCFFSMKRKNGSKTYGQRAVRYKFDKLLVQ